MRNDGLGSRDGIRHALRQWMRRNRALLALLAPIAEAVAPWARRIGAFVIPARLRSRNRLARYAPLVLVPVLVSAVAVPLLHGSQPARRPALSRAEPPALAQAAQLTQAAGKPVTLVTGDTMRLTAAPGGRAVVTPAPPKSRSGLPASSFTYSFEIGGDLYSVPGEALPYLGSLLDPRLFDVSYLRRAGYTGQDSVPVSITWRSQAHSPVPGVAAPATGRRTSGSIPAATASRFGRALAASLRRDTKPAAAATAPVAGGWPRTGPLSQVAKISLGTSPLAKQQAQDPLAGPAAPSGQVAVAPAVPLTAGSVPAGSSLYTLTVNTAESGTQQATGLSVFAVVAVQNLDSFQRFYSVSAVTPGQPLAVSVPAGHYSIEAVFFNLDFPGDTEAFACLAFHFCNNFSLVTVPEITVSHDTSVTMDAGQADPVNVTVPDPTAAPATAGMSFTRLSADHRGIGVYLWGLGPGVSSILPPFHMSAKPAPAPRMGSLSFADSWMFTPTDSGLNGADIPYTYSVDFASPNGVPATLSHTLAAKDLATVHDSFAASVDGDTAYYDTVPFHPWSGVAFALSPGLTPVSLPMRQADYFGGSAATIWEQVSDVQPPPSSTWYGPAIFGPYRTFHPGEEVNATWGASPSVPEPEWQSMGLPFIDTLQDLDFNKGDYSYICPVCRQGDVLSFLPVFSGDDDPTHTVAWYEGIGTFESLKFYRNGVLTQIGGPLQIFPMLPGKSSYRIDWSTTVPVSWARLGTREESVWDFTAARPAGDSRLPSYELCAPDPTQACSFVPLVFASYDFGADLQGQVAAPGTKTFTLTGYHQANENAPPVTSASVQVSFDDGSTWSPATSVTGLGGGRFRVTVTQPAPSATSGYASFKVTLADADGNTLTQTIIRAYALASGTATAQGSGR